MARSNKTVQTRLFDRVDLLLSKEGAPGELAEALTEVSRLFREGGGGGGTYVHVTHHSLCKSKYPGSLEVHKKCALFELVEMIAGVCFWEQEGVTLLII